MEGNLESIVAQNFILTSTFCLQILLKLDGVGPVDNRPFNNKLHPFVRKKKLWHVTCDTWNAKDEGLISSDLTFTKLQVMLGSHWVWHISSKYSVLGETGRYSCQRQVGETYPEESGMLSLFLFLPFEQVEIGVLYLLIMFFLEPRISESDFI